MWKRGTMEKRKFGKHVRWEVNGSGKIYTGCGELYAKRYRSLSMVIFSLNTNYVPNHTPPGCTVQGPRQGPVLLRDAVDRQHYIFCGAPLGILVRMQRHSSTPSAAKGLRTTLMDRLGYLWLLPKLWQGV